MTIVNLGIIMIGKKFLIFPILLLIILAIGSASATDEIALEESPINDIVEAPIIEEIEGNETCVVEDVQANKTTENNEPTPIAEDAQANKTTEIESASVAEDMQSLTDTTIKTKNINTYYKEKCVWTAYLKDFGNNPISNKKVSISINE